MITIVKLGTASGTQIIY